LGFNPSSLTLETKHSLKSAVFAPGKLLAAVYSKFCWSDQSFFPLLWLWGESDFIWDQSLCSIWKRELSRSKAASSFYPFQV